MCVCVGENCFLSHDCMYKDTCEVFPFNLCVCARVLFKL